MKLIRTLLSAVFIFVSLSSFTVINGDVNAALKAGNAFKVAAFFETKVDITILEKSDLVSKLEAEKMLYDFFYTHKPSDFKVLHEGKSKSGLEYVIGKLITNNGTYRLSYYINNVNNKERIQQIIIDSE